MAQHGFPWEVSLAVLLQRVPAKARVACGEELAEDKEQDAVKVKQLENWDLIVPHTPYPVPRPVPRTPYLIVNSGRASNAGTGTGTVLIWY